MEIRELSDEELEATIQAGEFPESIRLSHEHVVVVMTQDWCPQWGDMASWLPEFTDRARIYTSIYNRHKRFPWILNFKENVFRNREVPYVRVYYQGELMGVGNWMPKRTFTSLLERTTPLRMS